jgi:hypothetical protein
VDAAATHPEPPATRPVATVGHTLVLLAIMGALALAGAAFQGAAPTPGGAGRPNVFAIYVPLFASEWLMFFYVWRAGLRRSGTPLRELVGGPWSSPVAVVRDVLLGAALWGAWRLVELAWERVAPAGAARSVGEYLPRGVLEGVLWAALSATAGFVEEVVYRGYLQRQFAAWTGRPRLALVLQAVVFGVTHGYQGVDACIRITAFGLLFGVLAMWRHSLRPGMMAHALTDLVAGLCRS